MRKFLALVLSLIMAAGTVSTFASAAKFTDVPATDETLTKAVDLLSSVGITTGTTATTFGTSEGVTRQQMATFIYRLMKAGKTVEGGENTTTFKDLDDPFYYFMISWANDMGIIKGRSETSFDPKGGIILQDAYVMLVRALGYEKDGALEYPFDYIAIAEDIGLDEGIPASVNYDTALTRGNVAVLIYNAFYADMATGETAYEMEYEEVEVTGGKIQIVEKGMRPYTEYDTVAEDVFGIKRTVQRVVATPNHSLDAHEKTDSDVNDVEMITVECFDEDYIDTDYNLFSDIEFSSLGLEGTADDYFLIDLSIYYKKEANKEPEIVSASALGSRSKNIAGSKIKFETESGTNRENYMIYTSSQNREARFKRFTGKVTVDGTVSYLFNAPWSYSKPADILDKDNECITLLWLDATDRDPEDEEYVQDFNFKSDRDVTGRGAEYYSTLSRTTFYNSGKTETHTLGEEDLRGVGLYTSWGFYTSMIIDPHNGGNYFEADAWDSNGDGKIDYMWLKPYTTGQVIEEEGEPFIEMHGQSSDVMDNYGCIYDQYKVPSIYTYGATNGGADYKDGQIIIGYINGPANYMRVSSVSELKYETQTFTGKRGSDANNIAINGSYGGRWGASLKYIGFPGNDGSRPGYTLSNGQLTSGGPYITAFFKDANLGKTFKIAYVSGLMFHVQPASGTLGADDYAIIFPNTNGAYAYTSSVGVVTDGNLQKTGNFLEVMIDGELQDVLVKPQPSASVAADNIMEDETGKAIKDSDGNTISSMPVTEKQKNGVYDFSAYVGKLLTYTVNSDDEYVFKIAALDANKDKSVLSTEDEEAYYTYEADTEGKTTSAFVNVRNNLYQFVISGSNNLNSIAPSKYVSITDNTKIVVLTYDDDDEPVFTYYDSENLPNFSDEVDFKSIKYIVKNNPSSTTIEELIYLYAESTDGQVIDDIGNTLDYRFVKASKGVRVEDEIVTYVDVYNPFTGVIEEEYELYNEGATVDLNGIYALTSGGYIADDHKLGSIDALGNVALDATKLSTEGLGLVAIEEYDKDNGILTVDAEVTDMIFKVTDNTIISFLDVDNGTIDLQKTDAILSSTSKNYRCNDNKNIPLLAFIASTEIKKETEMEEARLIVVVRYNALDTTEDETAE